MKSSKDAVDTSTPAAAGYEAIPILPNGPGAEAVSVDKIRDLLFGNQMQDYDRRFANLEERFLQRLKEIESESARSLAAAEANAKKQVDSLASQLREESDARADADRETERNLRESTQALEKRVRQLTDQLGQLERELTDRITHTAQTLRDESRKRNDDTREGFERMLGELGNVKTDRNLLAGLFAEVAKCLSHEAAPKVGNGKGIDPSRVWHPS